MPKETIRISNNMNGLPNMKDVQNKNRIKAEKILYEKRPFINKNHKLLARLL